MQEIIFNLISFSNSLAWGSLSPLLVVIYFLVASVVGGMFYFVFRNKTFMGEDLIPVGIMVVLGCVLGIGGWMYHYTFKVDNYKVGSCFREDLPVAGLQLGRIKELKDLELSLKEKVRAFNLAQQLKAENAQDLAESITSLQNEINKLKTQPPIDPAYNYVVLGHKAGQHLTYVQETKIVMLGFNLQHNRYQVECSPELLALVSQVN